MYYDGFSPRRGLIAAAAILAIALSAGSAFAEATLDGLSQVIAGNGQLSDAQKQQASATIAELKADDETPAYIASEVLMEVYPKFAEAMTALGEEEVAPAITQLDELAKSDDKILAAEATYYIGRAHMMSEKYELALPVWKSVLEAHAENTFRTGEALFFKGMCESQLLQRKEAIASLDKFIIDFEFAPERMQVAAWHELELLRAIEDGSLVDVQDRMDFSRRRIAIEETGDDTQEEQDRIVAMLDKLIEKAEQQEKGGGSCPNGGQGSGQGQGQGSGSGQGQGQGGSNGSEGAGGGGAASGNPDHPLDEASRGTRSASRTPWGKVRNPEREAEAFAALKKKFPGRYKELVEQYYRSLNEEEFEE